MSYRELSAQPQADSDFSQFLDYLQSALTDGRRDPNDVVRDTLHDIYFGWATVELQRRGAQDPERLSLATRAMLHSFDPRNITTEPEYYRDIDNVYNRMTRIRDGARITYHATVLAGVEVGEYAMLGTGAVATEDVEPYHIKVGVPAKTVKVKRSQGGAKLSHSSSE